MVDRRYPKRDPEKYPLVRAAGEAVHLHIHDVEVSLIIDSRRIFGNIDDRYFTHVELDWQSIKESYLHDAETGEVINARGDELIPHPFAEEMVINAQFIRRQLPQRDHTQHMQHLSQMAFYTTEDMSDLVEFMFPKTMRFCACIWASPQHTNKHSNVRCDKDCCPAGCKFYTSELTDGTHDKE